MLLLCCCSCCCPSSETDERGERGERGVSHTRGWKSKRVRDDDKRRRRRRRRSGERRRSTRPRDEGRGTAPAFSQPPQAVPLGLSLSLSLSKEREKKEEDRVRAQDSVLRCAALPCVRHDHAHGRRRPRRRRAKLGPRCLRCGALTINQLALIACVRLGGEAFLLPPFFLSSHFV